MFTPNTGIQLCIYMLTQRLTHTVIIFKCIHIYIKMFTHTQIIIFMYVFLLSVIRIFSNTHVRIHTHTWLSPPLHCHWAVLLCFPGRWSASSCVPTRLAARCQTGLAAGLRVS